jgi:hypothetical protein
MARQNEAQCFVGRDNTRTNRNEYITYYWR